MAATIDSGIPGLQLAQGDHICAFYQGQRGRFELLLPFLRAGLAAGEKCICVVEASDIPALANELGSDGREAGTGVEHQLDLLPAEQVYLQTGAFEADLMLDFWDDVVSTAVRSEGFSFVRSAGDTTWALSDPPGVNGLVAYEARINRFLPLYPQIILCLYDMTRLSGHLLVEMVKTHPRILVQGTVVENPDYLEPDEFLAGRE